jgi:hypothetical protein
MRVIFTLSLLLSFSMIWSQKPPIISGSKKEVQNLKILAAAELIRTEPVALKNTLQGNINEINCLVKPLHVHKSVNLQNGLTGKVAGLNVQKTDSGVYGSKRIGGCNGRRCFTGNNQPLLIIDGVKMELKFLSEVNPAEIQSVEVLKSAPATALLGSDGVNGAIWIETRKSLIRKFIIKDFLDGSGLAGATVSIISIDKKDTMMYVANDSGLVITDKLKKISRYQITVSAVGYQILNVIFENNYRVVEKEILLTREVKTCQEVIISNTNCMMCGGTTFYCKVSGRRITVGKNTDIEKRILLPPFKLYPNPVQKGGIINIEMTSADNKPVKLNLFNQGGQVVFLKEQELYKGANSFTINTDSRWAAGIYFVQLVYENGRVLASEKIIIQ